MTANFLWTSGGSNSGLLTTTKVLLADTSEMASLVTANGVVSTTSGASGKFTNSDTAQAIWGELFLKLGAVTGTIAAGANVAGWFLTSPDSGTTYETTTSSTIMPPRPPDFIIPIPATTNIAANSVFKAAGLVRIPALQFKVMIQNNVGFTLAASGNTLTLATVAVQY